MLTVIKTYQFNSKIMKMKRKGVYITLGVP